MKTKLHKFTLASLSLLGLSGILLPTSLSLVACTSQPINEQDETVITSPETTKIPLTELQTQADQIDNLHDAYIFVNQVVSKYYTLAMLISDYQTFAKQTYDVDDIYAPEERNYQNGEDTTHMIIKMLPIIADDDQSVLFIYQTDAFQTVVTSDGLYHKITKHIQTYKIQVTPCLTILPETQTNTIGIQLSIMYVNNDITVTETTDDNPRQARYNHNQQNFNPPSLLLTMVAQQLKITFPLLNS